MKLNELFQCPLCGRDLTKMDIKNIRHGIIGAKWEGERDICETCFNRMLQVDIPKHPAKPMGCLEWLGIIVTIIAGVVIIWFHYIHYLGGK